MFIKKLVYDLFIYISNSLFSIYLSFYLSFLFLLFVRLFVCLFVPFFLSIPFFFSLSFYLFLNLLVNLSHSFSVYLSIYLSIYLSPFLDISDFTIRKLTYRNNYILYNQATTLKLLQKTANGSFFTNYLDTLKYQDIFNFYTDINHLI